MSAIEKYLDFLWSCFQFDMHTFSHAWMYYYFLVPAIGYFMFFIVKWMVLTIPVWMPISLLMRIANIPSPKCRNCTYKTAHDYDFSDQADLETGSNEHEPGKFARTANKLESFTTELHF